MQRFHRAPGALLRHQAVVGEQRAAKLSHRRLRHQRCYVDCVKHSLCDRAEKTIRGLFGIAVLA